MSSETSAEELNTPSTRDNSKKRIRHQRSPQADDDKQQDGFLLEQQDGATTSAERLKHVEEKLDKFHLMLSEFQHPKARVSKLEEENRVCQTALNSCRKT